MKRIIITITILLLAINWANAQKEASIWHFGQGSGIDFNQMRTVNNATINGVTNQTLAGVPTYIDGPIVTAEGCFAISDREGNLLFSSDGSFVYNKNKVQMPHGVGLKGHSSAAQSGIVIPRPGHPKRYYIVTAPAKEERGNGLYYYEVDLELDGGLGDVMGPYVGNVPTGTPLNFPSNHYPNIQAYENIAAVGHANGRDFWLMHRCRNQFYVWLITKDGITTSIPFKNFAIGSDPGYDTNPAVHGYLKFSPDGKYIAVTNYFKRNIVIGKFDSSTGNVSNIKMRDLSANANAHAYGLSFTPNNKYLYFTYLYTGPLYRVAVDAFLSGSGAITPTQIYGDGVVNVQLGADNRMYGIASYSSSPTTFRNLFIFDDLEAATPKIIKIPDFFPANRGAHLSIPTFTSSFFAANDLLMDPLDGCINQEITLSVQVNAGNGIDAVTKLVWNFGDGSPLVEDTDMNQLLHAVQHTYTKVGTYTLTLIPYRMDGQMLVDKIQSMPINIGSCALPVNHNISNMRY